MPAIHDPVAQSGRTPLQRPLSCSQHNHSPTSRPWQIRCPVPVQPPGKSHAPALHAGKSQTPHRSAAAQCAAWTAPYRQSPPLNAHYDQLLTDSRSCSVSGMDSSLQTSAPAQCAAWTAPYRKQLPLSTHYDQLPTDSRTRSALNVSAFLQTAAPCHGKLNFRHDKAHLAALFMQVSVFCIGGNYEGGEVRVHPAPEDIVSAQCYDCKLTRL